MSFKASSYSKLISKTGFQKPIGGASLVAERKECDVTLASFKEEACTSNGWRLACYVLNDGFQYG